MNNYKGGGGRFKKGRSKSKFEGKKSFGNDKKYGSSKKFSGGQGQSGRTTGPTAQLFSATCSECGKKCDVPFKPSHDKPVYCSDCFGAKKNANESRGSEGGGNRSDKGSRNERPDYTKLPREERPARHNTTRGRGDDGIADLKRQISGLEIKLNRILDLINPPMPSQKVSLPEKAVEKTAPKKVVAKKVVKKAVAKVSPKKAEVKAAPKKAAPKQTPKKAAAKTAKEVSPKKATVKTTVKKVVKKVTKAAPKKATVKKVVKKTKK